jgi:hypothetical protein
MPATQKRVMYVRAKAPQVQGQGTRFAYLLSKLKYITQTQLPYVKELICLVQKST